MQYQFCYLELFTCRIYHAIMIHCLLPNCRTDIFAVSPLPNALHTRSRPRPLGGGGGRGLSCGLRRRYRKGRDKLRKTAQGKEERSWSEVGLTDALIESERPLTVDRVKASDTQRETKNIPAGHRRFGEVSKRKNAVV